PNEQEPPPENVSPLAAAIIGAPETRSINDCVESPMPAASSLSGPPNSSSPEHSSPMAQPSIPPLPFLSEQAGPVHVPDSDKVLPLPSLIVVALLLLTSVLQL